MQRVTNKPRRKFNHQHKGKFNKFNKKRREPTFDQMMRKFKKDTEKSGIIKECKKRESMRSLLQSVDVRRTRHLEE